MVHHGQGRFGTANRTAGRSQTLESLRAADFMYQMPVDIQDAGSVLEALDHVAVPQLIEKSTRHTDPDRTTLHTYKVKERACIILYGRCNCFAKFSI
jgi:hypothetical protein